MPSYGCGDLDAPPFCRLPTRPALGTDELPKYARSRCARSGSSGGETNTSSGNPNSPPVDWQPRFALELYAHPMDGVARSATRAQASDGSNFHRTVGPFHDFSLF